MLFLLQRYQEVILTSLKMTENIFKSTILSSLYKPNVRVGWIGISNFYPTGKPISPHRLRCSPIVVYKYNSWATALPLL
jgi:hypothetical protein